jgi:AcrR family transcriptional regulator
MRKGIRQASVTSQQSVHRGRPRDASAQESILKATRDILAASGYARLTIEGVAAKAGAGKATIYRWWPSKWQLVLEATAAHLAIGVVPDTGDTRRDLIVAAGQLIKTFSDRLAAIVIYAVIASLDDDPKFARAFRDTWVLPWRQSAEEAIRRGIARGNLAADTDANFVLDVIVGTVLQRTLVVPQPLTEGLAEALVELIVPR